MRKKATWLLTLTITTFILSACGTNNSSSTQINEASTSPTTVVKVPSTSPETEPTVEPTVSPSPTAEVSASPSPTVTPSSVSASDSIYNQDYIDNMMPVLDSLTRFMVENETPYNPNDKEVFWTALSYIINNYGTSHPFVESYPDGTIVAKRQVVQEYASAMFYDYNDLLEIPDSLEGFVTYDKDYDAYSFAGSDRSESEVSIVDSTDNKDGTITVTTSLGGEHVNCIFTLVSNPYVSGISDPSFYYSVSKATFSED